MNLICRKRMEKNNGRNNNYTFYSVNNVFFMTSTMMWIKRINDRINDLEREIYMHLKGEEEC